jgi:DNA-binding MarR family transcriptional regulator
VSRSQRRRADQEPWLPAAPLCAFRAFMAVQMRLNYEMNRQLQSDSGLSLADYHVLNALTDAPDGRLQVSDLAALIGWERSRASHQLRRLCERGLAERIRSEVDGRATDATLTKAGREAMAAAAHRSLRRWNTSASTSTSTAPCHRLRGEQVRTLEGRLLPTQPRGIDLAINMIYHLS